MLFDKRIQSHQNRIKVGEIISLLQPLNQLADEITTKCLMFPK